MRRSRIAAALLLVLAAALALGLVRFRTQVVITHGDYFFSWVTKSFEGEPALTIYEDVIDFACSRQHPCRNMASARIVGLFPRDGVPLVIAFWGGIVAPLLLAGSAFATLIWPLKNRARIVRGLGAGVLILIGGLLLVPLGMTIATALRQHSLSPISLNDRSLTLFSAPALSLLAVGIWLGVSAFRSRN